MQKKLLIAAAAIVALGAASFLLIGKSSPPTVTVAPAPAPPAEPAREPPPPPPAPQATAPTPAPIPTPPTTAPPEPEVPPAEEEVLRDQPAGADRRPWDEIDPLPRGWPALMARISRLQPKSSECAEQLSRARIRRTSPRRPAPDDPAATVLMLQLETTNGEVHVLDAPIETRGGASDGVVQCLQATLKGAAIPLAGTRDGQRMKLRFPIR
jgi:hypothetical protein